ncbi:MAG: hypothetical protein IIB13_02615 [Chloroflexi bacterium]|nr:hypothetical protein [Chloroflexota bacterium]
MALKYCGSCNPLINLSQIGHDLLTAIEKEDDLVFVSPESTDINTLVILCGCARACGNLIETRARAKRSIVVAGETIDMTPVAEINISGTLTEKLRKVK